MPDETNGDDPSIEFLPDHIYASEWDDPLVAVPPSERDFESIDEKIARITQRALDAEGETLDLSQELLTDWFANPPENLLAAISKATVIDLSQNRLTELPEKMVSCIANAESLIALDLSGNRLTDLPEHFGDLQVEWLDCSDNHFERFPSQIRRLRKLATLVITDCGLGEVPGNFATDVLRNVDLSGNLLVEVPEFISRSPTLEVISLNQNKISAATSRQFASTHLQDLRMSGNHLASFPVNLTHTRLRSIDLRGNRLTTFKPRLPASVREILLSDNSLTDPPAVHRATSLTTLDLANNELRSLPSNYSKLPINILLHLGGNDWREPLPALIDRGTDSLLTYLASLTSSVEMHEAKLMLVGEGEVGKSSLLAAMRDEPFVLGRSTTHGIEMDTLLLPHPRRRNVSIRLNTWDFGGQEVYRITHQFFFTRRAIYLLVWKPRIGQDESGVESWLRRLHLRIGNDAKVIVVATHGDERQAEIDFPLLQEKYPNLVAEFHVVDSRSKRGLKNLLKSVARLATELPQMGEPINSNWATAREAVRKIEEPFISRVDFERICDSCDLPESDFEVLADLLHDFGQIISYGDDDGLREFIVLQPEWLTKAIGIVLEDDQCRKAGGVLQHARLNDLWNPKSGMQYDPRHHAYFLRLMEKFDVSYRLPSGVASLVAQLVPHQRPVVALPRTRNLTMICRTSSPAPGLVSWLTVRNSRYSINTHWRRGVALEDSRHNSLAIFELASDDVSLTLTVNAPAPAFFFDIMRSSLEQLFEDRWPGIRYQLVVPCRSNVAQRARRRCNGVFKLSTLETLRQRGIRDVLCQECVSDNRVQELLTGISEEQVSLTQVANRIESMMRTVSDIEITSAEAARFSRNAVAILASEVTDCPRLFTLTPAFRSTLKKKLSLTDPATLALWCEEPGEEHRVDSATYEVRNLKTWAAEIAPYAATILRILRAALPVATAAFGVLDPGASDRSKAELDLMGALLDAVPSEGFAGDGTPFGSRMTRAEGAGLRGFRSLLLEMDSRRHFGGMRRARSSSGDLLWVCQHHYSRYDPGLPTLG